VWECLCGAPPFADRQGMRVLWAHLQDMPQSPCERRPDVPAEVGETILQAVAKEPSERPQSAGDFARKLRASAGL
jgi:serine/threonine protein kinase